MSQRHYELTGFCQAHNGKSATDLSGGLGDGQALLPDSAHCAKLSPPGALGTAL